MTTRSAFLLLRQAFYGATRFDDFAERAGLSEPVTAAPLKKLVEKRHPRRMGASRSDD